MPTPGQIKAPRTPGKCQGKRNHSFPGTLEPTIGLEPMTCRLRIDCSTQLSYVGLKVDSNGVVVIFATPSLHIYCTSTFRCTFRRENCSIASTDCFGSDLM